MTTGDVEQLSDDCKHPVVRNTETMTADTTGIATFVTLTLKVANIMYGTWYQNTRPSRLKEGWFETECTFLNEACVRHAHGSEYFAKSPPKH